MEDYGEAMISNQNTIVQALTKMQNRANVLQLKVLMTSGYTRLEPNMEPARKLIIFFNNCKLIFKLIYFSIVALFSAMIVQHTCIVINAARAAFYRYIPPVRLRHLFCLLLCCYWFFFALNKATKVYKKLVCLKSKKNTRQNSRRGCCLGICELKSKNVDQYEKKLDDMEGNMITEQRSAAGKASFFVAYVVTSGWTKTFSSEFFQVKRLMLSILKGSLCCDFYDELEVPSNPYHKEIPRILFFSLLGITYFFLAPLILQFVLIYYGLGYIIYRNQLLNGYAPKFETGLVYWGLVLTKQFPTLVTHQESLESKVNETKATVKFQLKKVFCMGVAVENLDMEEKLFQNIQMSVNFLVYLLQKNWQNLRCLSLKSTMGKMQCIFREPFLCVLEF
ncbi:hypothetical protein OROMI_014842 [Orobanche minor]